MAWLPVSAPSAGTYSSLSSSFQRRSAPSRASVCSIVIEPRRRWTSAAWYGRVTPRKRESRFQLCSIVATGVSIFFPPLSVMKTDPSVTNRPAPALHWMRLAIAKEIADALSYPAPPLAGPASPADRGLSRRRSGSAGPVHLSGRLLRADRGERRQRRRLRRRCSGASGHRLEARRLPALRGWQAGRADELLCRCRSGIYTGDGEQ